MNIMLVNYEYPPVGAGAANATYHIARSLMNKGCHTVVLTGSYKELRGKCIEEGITIYRGNCLRRRKDKSNLLEMFTFLLSAIFLYPKLLKSERIQYSIIFFSFPCGPIGLLGRLLIGTPYIVSLRGGDVPGNEPQLKLLHFFLLPLRRLIFKYSRGVVANSSGLKMLSEKHDPFAVHFIPNGVDTDFFKVGDKDNILFSPYIFLFVGRLHQQKNLFYLLDQMAKLKAETTKSFILRIVGDGPQKERLQRYCLSLNLTDVVFWYDWLDKQSLKEQYLSCHCFINLSLYEGMPNTVLEAMASGLPVIGSDVTGNNEIIIDSVTGFLVNFEDQDQFSKAAVKLIEDPKIGINLGLMGRETVARYYTWDKVADNYLNLLENVKA